MSHPCLALLIAPLALGIKFAPVTMAGRVLHDLGPTSFSDLISAIHFVLGPLAAFLFDHPSDFTLEGLTPFLRTGLFV